MTIQPSDWEEAAASLAAVRPRNTFEIAAKAQLQTELNNAVQLFKLGGHLHSRVTPGLWPNYVFLESPITTIDLAITLVDTFRDPVARHVRDDAAHAMLLRPVSAIGTGIGANFAANTIRAQLNAHVALAGAHFGDASAAVVSSPEATDDPSLITLAEELRIKVPLHVKDGGSIVFEQSVNVSEAQASYQAKLRVWRDAYAAASMAFDNAEPVARIGASVLGYAPSPAWAKLNGIAEYATLVQRLSTLQTLPGFAANAYTADVVAPAASALASAPPPGAAPTAPTNTTVVIIVGTVSPSAEAALLQVISDIVEFVAGCSVAG